MKKYGSNHLAAALFLSLYLILGVTWNAGAQQLPSAVSEAIDQAFPNARITDISKDSYQGQAVTEVELVDENGNPYEVHISNDGRILKAKREDDGLPWIGGELSIGLAVFAEKEIYKGADDEIQSAVFLRYENGPFEIMTTDAIDVSYELFDTSLFSTALKGSILLGEGYDPDDNTYLKGMEELDTLFYVGLGFEKQFAGWEISLEVLQDVSGEHDGQEIELALEYQWNAAGFEFRPNVSLTWMSGRTVDYFYGVSSKEARVDRKAYSPGSSYESSAELVVERVIFGNFSAVGIIGVSAFGGDITDSPIVDEDYSTQVGFGIMYAF